MNKELSDKHTHEWEVFDVLSTMALNELIEEEISVHKQYGMLSDHLPQEWRNKLERNRQTWLQEWGGRGKQATKLASSHQEEIEEDDIGKMFDDMFRQDEADRELKREIELAIQEKNAVTSHYELKDRPVPNATQQRFAKRFLELQDRYEGKEYQIRRTLDDHDLNDEAECWNALIKQHEIIRTHYQRAEYIPQLSIVQMKKEVREFNAEYMTFRQLNKAQTKEEADPAQADATLGRDEFKEHLRAIHERSQQHRPKPRSSQ